jgi:uncharacterized membrane protein SpoIIM required for sporulation
MSGFVARNKPTWDELETLVRRARKSVRSMTPDEMNRLDVLYRRTTIHLAQVSTRSSDQALVRYLNDLTASAHSVIYVPPRQSMFAGFARFVVDVIPRSLARNGPYHLVSAALLIGGAVIAYFSAMADPLAAYALWSPGDERQPGSTYDQLLEVLRHGRDDSGGEKFLFASFLFQNNLRVGILAAATGVAAGVPSVILMFYNGMLLGVFAAIHHRAGITAEIWAWILPHGVTEMLAVVLCGGVGLMLGYAVIAPGLRTRRDALHDAGREAGVTIACAFGMLVFAAIVESFLRQSHLSTGARLMFAAATAVFWVLVFVYGYVRERAVNSQRSAAM